MPENSPLHRGIELGYLVIHAEPLWLVFLKSRLKKHLSRVILLKLTLTCASSFMVLPCLC